MIMVGTDSRGGAGLVVYSVLPWLTVAGGYFKKFFFTGATVIFQLLG